MIAVNKDWLAGAAGEWLAKVKAHLQDAPADCKCAVHASARLANEAE